MNRGFTLVELLVVVAILALLLTLLMPALGRAKDIARLTLCKTNLKGIGTALSMYMNDSDGWTPKMVDMNPDGSGPYVTPTWPSRLEPAYVDKGGAAETIFACPAEPVEYEPYCDEYKKRNFSYFSNYDAMGIGWTSASSKIVTMSNMFSWTAPGKFYFVVESNGSPSPRWYSPWSLSAGTFYNPISIIGYPDRPATWAHDFKDPPVKNTLYGDFHVEGLTENQLCWDHSLWPNDNYTATQENWRVAPYQSGEWYKARRQFQYHGDQRVPYWEEL